MRKVSLNLISFYVYHDNVYKNLMNMATVSGDLHKDTSSILVEEKLDEEGLLDRRENKRKILSMLVVYYEKNLTRYYFYISAATYLRYTRKSISDNSGAVDEAENLLMQSPSSFINRDDNVSDESDFTIQSSNVQVDSEEVQPEDNYEMPIATIVNDEEVALPHAEPAQIDDDIIIVDAEVCLITT